MSYILILFALTATIAAALGETHTKTGGRRRLTRVGLIVVSAAVLTAGVSIFENLNQGRARSRLQSIWTRELQGTVAIATRLNEYLLQNARQEVEKGPNPHRLYDDRGKQLRPPLRTTSMQFHSGITPLSRDEAITLLAEFNVNPPRYPWQSWPAPISWRPQRVLTMDDRISHIADDIIQSLERITEEFGDLMAPGERANIEELRRSSYLVHLASIKNIAADARLREDSYTYPVCILQPGISGAPIEDYDKFLELLEEIKISVE